MDGRQIAGLAGEWTKAELEGDPDFLTRALADDFVAVGPRGFVLDKEEWISRHAAGNLTYKSLDLDEVSVRDYGGAAVMVCAQRSHAVYRDGEARYELDDDLRMTMFFVAVGGRTLIVGLQLSPIAGPPAAETP